MFSILQVVQIVNHAEPSCNGQYGTIVDITESYSGERYYVVELEDFKFCDCTDDELMEG